MNPSPTFTPRASRPADPSSRRRDPILDDLRAFAQEKGIVGCVAMDREELVESLRQRYLLETMLRGRRASR